MTTPAPRCTGPHNLAPIDWREARRLVERYHRHHRPPPGAKAWAGLTCGTARLVGGYVLGRPVSRMLDDGATLEVTRNTVEEGHANAASKLLGAAVRVAFGLGYRRVVSYTLDSEPGVSYKAAGFRLVAESRGGSWDRRNRPRVDKHPLQAKLRWEVP